jgi:hypothetical protein
MILKGSGQPQFRTKHISTLWKSKILDLKTHKERIPKSLLVALDIESSVQGVSEIGLAFLRVHEKEPLFCGDGTIQTFHSQNKVQTYTIQDSDRVPKKNTSREAIKVGTIVLVDVEEVGPTVNGSLILVGFDLYNTNNISVTTNSSYFEFNCP